jgi:hypothetical protein
VDGPGALICVTGLILPQQSGDLVDLVPLRILRVFLKRFFFPDGSELA